MRTILVGLLVAVALVAAAFAYVYMGVFSVAADEPHSGFVYALMDAVRSRSIAVRARDIRTPALDDARLVEAGARHYAEMCTGCHLAPGESDSEIRAGLYPQPPDLSEHSHTSPAEAFWIIKHGIKMTGMPAWGATHDDESIWGLVAFLQQLPEMGPDRYQELTARKEETGHRHVHGNGARKPASHRTEEAAAHEDRPH